MRAMDELQKRDRRHLIAFLHISFTAMSGGLLAIGRDWFFEIGGHDQAMKVRHSVILPSHMSVYIRHNT